MSSRARGLRVLLTRPRPDAEPFAELLNAHGHEAVIAPLLTIAPVAEAHDRLHLAGVQAVLFTSANGVRAFAAATPRRDLRVLAVGPASAAAARGEGFAQVESADGDVEALAALAVARLRPDDGALLHAAGTVTAGDLQGRLAAAGFDVRRVQLYEARTVEGLPETLGTALSRGDLDAAAFFSPRTAETFVRLVRDARMEGYCAAVTAVCLSDAVAAGVRGIQWAAVRVAVRPDGDALLWCLNESRSAGTPALTETGMADDNARDDAAQPPGEPETEKAAPAAVSEGKADGPHEDIHDGPAHRIIAQFGGIRPMANKLGVAVSTVQGWRERGTIPAARHGQIVAAAAEQNIAIDRDDLAVSAAAGDGGALPKPASSRIPGSGRAEKPAAAASPAATASNARAEADGVTTGSPQAGAGERRGRSAGALLGAFILGAAVLGLGAGTAVMTRDIWLPLVEPGARGGVSEDQLAALEARLSDRLAGIEQSARGTAQEGAARIEGGLAAVTDRLDALEARAARQSADADSRLGELPALQERSERTSRAVDDLTGRVETLAATVGDLRETTGALQERLAQAVEARQEARTAASDRAAVALAVLQLRDALRSDEPFPEELAAVRSVAAEAPEPMRASLDEAAETLSSYADEGVPSLVSLTAAFPETARRIVAAGSAGAEDDWMADIKRRVSGLVSVRPVGPVEGDGPSAVVARAEAQLDAGNLHAAVAELESLSGPAAEAARPWLEEAKARLAANQALATLARSVASGSAAGAAGG